MLTKYEKRNECSAESLNEHWNGMSLSLELLPFLEQPSTSQGIFIEFSRKTENAFSTESTDVIQEEFLIETIPSNPIIILMKQKATDLPNYRISPIHSNESDVYNTDSDPNYDLNNKTEKKMSCSKKHKHLLESVLVTLHYTISASSSTISSSSESECSNEEKIRKEKNAQEILKDQKITKHQSNMP